MAIRRKFIWKLKITHEGILCWMLSLTMLVDFLNGLIPQINFGAIYRFVLLAFTIYVTAINSRKRFMPMLLGGVFFLLNTLISSFYHGDTSGIVYDLKMMMRILTSLCTCSAIISLYHKNKFTLNMIQKIIENNLMYTPALFIGTYILGIGSVSYTHNAVGFKSVFLSLNSVNVALIVMFAYAVFQMFTTQKVLRWCLLSIYVVIPMVMLGTKTALALIIVIPVMCIILNLKSKKGRVAGVAIIALSLVVVFFFLDKILLAMQGILDRQLYLFQNRDLISYLFSGRNWVLEQAVEYYATDYGFFEYLFGAGYFRSHNEIANITGYLSADGVRPVEMDWADILLAYGPLGFIPTYCYSFKILFRGAKFFGKKSVQPYWITALLVITFGSLAGHVYIEAISSTFLSFMLCAVYISSSDLNWLMRRGKRVEVLSNDPEMYMQIT